ncbi:hypothetical protein C5B42_03710 [Candidatus Cerribacteria bacterium 'Amazon FNV 2010 28 9']|uniref:Transcriptional repressor n=1 Tax=Candidatus Cerribacteria bacterium 'Amazon FNV 2010 28 9' TaxID=2081795 RepID=A0A317JNC6_9BACT|nr:MAG: hypothetical protein C5B42_03710 [Candidatus Cerribacteria bacterium 'Amazon FNV 2010 28 9']
MARASTTQHEICELLQTHHILSAVDILEKLNHGGKKHNKTTIYRSLEKMLENGTICRHSFETDTLYYELRHAHHDHLICEQCGKVEIAQCAFKAPVTLNGFSITHHHLTLYGLCSTCKTA